MICKNCSENFETPLILYDGRLACPFCTKELTDVGDFRVTRESEEDYRTAELGFFKWLEHPSAETEKYLARSIEACVRAARAGHPKAVLRLGYLYEKGYAEELRGRSECSTIAYGYYKKVCFADNVGVKVSDGVTGYGEAEFALIRKEAAKRLLSLIASLSASEGVSLRSRANMDAVLHRVLQRYPSLSGYSEHALATTETDRVERFSGVLSAVASNGRTPLFGVFRLSSSEMQTLFSAVRAKMIFKLIDAGLMLWHAPCGEDGLIPESSDCRFQALTNRKLVSEYLSSLPKNASGYLYFFNDTGKRRALKKTAVERVKKDLSADGFALVKRIANKGGQSEYTFYDDDILVNKTRLSFDRAAQLLAEDVVKNANESF